jgi:hypothetical protein
MIGMQATLFEDETTTPLVYVRESNGSISIMPPGELLDRAMPASVTTITHDLASSE